jgi:hypothetical protein
MKILYLFTIQYQKEPLKMYSISYAIALSALLIQVCLHAQPQEEECPGPFGERGDKYAQCEQRIQTILKTKDSAWFAERGMDGGRCSIQQYLSEQPAKLCSPVVTPSSAPTDAYYYYDNGPSEEKFFTDLRSLRKAE